MSRGLSAHSRYMPTPEWLALILAKRGCRRGQRLISWRAMVNEHAQKVRVKRGYYTYFASSACLVDPPGAGMLVLRTSMSLTRGVCGSRHQTLTTARRHDAISSCPWP
jgi:hypothetical protein